MINNEPKHAHYLLGLRNRRSHLQKLNTKITRPRRGQQKGQRSTSINIKMGDEN